MAQKKHSRPAFFVFCSGLQEQGHDGEGDGELARLRDEVRALETARLLDIQELEDCKYVLTAR